MLRPSSFEERRELPHELAEGRRVQSRQRQLVAEEAALARADEDRRQRLHGLGVGATDVVTRGKLELHVRGTDVLARAHDGLIR